MSDASSVEGTAPEKQSSPPRSQGISLVRWLLLAAALALVISVLCQPGWPLHGYELKTIDSRFRFRTSPPAAEHVVIVAIDERSLNDSRLGRWPWDRKWHADLIRRLTAENPGSIAFDVIFSEPSSIASDTDLASAMAASRRVFLAMHAAELAGKPGDQGVAHRFAVEPGLVTAQKYLPQVGAVVPPLPQFATVAAGGGVIAGLPDADGVMRRLYLLSRETRSGAMYPNLLLSLAAANLRWDYAAMRLNLGVAGQLSPQAAVPLERGAALVNYLGPADTIPKLSYIDVLDGRFPAGMLRGKIVLVGFTAPGLLDQYPTPLSPSMAGVEIQAQMLENLLQSLFLKTSGFGNMLGIALVLALVAAVAATSTRPVLGLAIVLLMLGLYNVGSLGAFSESATVWPGLAPNLAAVMAFAGIAVFRLSTEEAGRRRLREEFGRYAPPQVVARLDSGEMKVRAAGVKRPVTSLFADVRGFTAWSASADPHDVISVLNTYYESMTQLAFDVEGTVDNIVGDEIFVTFNAIEDQPDHTGRAVDLALNMIAALEGLNERWLKQGTLPAPLRIGVGINSGEALVGNLGSRVRTQYTVLGQSVNLAARLQALNKDLGTTILATKDVADAVAHRVQLRAHGMKEIRGHPVPVEVVEIVGRLGERVG
ncbi:MAG: CHASE2 domain-containing protein [Armatimonadota bacterium]